MQMTLTQDSKLPGGFVNKVALIRILFATSIKKENIECPTVIHGYYRGTNVSKHDTSFLSL